MLGDIIARLHEPGAAEAALIEVGNLALLAGVRTAAGLFDLETGEFVSLAVRRFLERADDDAWLQLVGVMGKSETPGLEALSAILRRAVADAHEAAA